MSPTPQPGIGTGRWSKFQRLGKWSVLHRALEEICKLFICTDFAFEDLLVFPGLKTTIRLFCAPKAIMV